MHRFFIDRSIQTSEVSLEGKEWHHCQTVLRAEKGDRLVIFDGMGSEYIAELIEASRKTGRLRIVQKEVTPRPPYSITLAQSLPKNKIMDFIVQKATELGVQQLIPMFSERSSVRPKENEAESKVARWKEITIESAKQCGLNWLPSVTYPKSFREVIEISSNFRFKYVGSLQPDAKPLWCYQEALPRNLEPILLMIGPEGDLTLEELSIAQNAGFYPLSLGPLVLRCDTAVIYSISTLCYELQRSR